METTQSTRPTTELEKNVCEYLNDLRESGVTNMFGAAPYVEDEFGLNKGEARRILSLWMANFNPEGNYQTVKL
jgi:hypothetical protein